MRPLSNIPHCCLPKESGPCLSPSVAGRPLRPATDRRLGRPLPHQQANRTQATPKAPEGFEPQLICGISPSFPGLSPTSGHIPTRYSPVRHSPCRACDLHVLSIPPAFALSQDQTLRFAPQHPCQDTPENSPQYPINQHHQPPLPQNHPAASVSQQHPPQQPTGRHRSAVHASHSPSSKGDQDTNTHQPNRPKTGTTSKRQKRTSNTDANVNEQRHGRSRWQIARSGLPFPLREREDRCLAIGAPLQRGSDNGVSASSRQPRTASRCAASTPRRRMGQHPHPLVPLLARTLWTNGLNVLLWLDSHACDCRPD